MERRKFLLGVGSLAAAGTAAVGTGAFSSNTIPDRQVSVSIDDDENSMIALVPSDMHEDDVSLEDGQLTLDLSGSNGEGVNINSRYTWGDPDNPADDHAFKIQNNDEGSYAMKMNYFFTNTGWISNHGDGQSYIRFEIFDEPPSNSGSSAENYPHRSYNRDYSLGGPTGNWNPVGGYRFNPGEEYYVVVTVDTTGPNASVNDELSGEAEFHFSNDGVSQQSWYPENPPN